MEISLSNLKWQVKGYWPYVPIKEKSMETGQTLHGVTPWIEAKVPGGVHYDLWKAGYIDNPYYARNSLNCEWVENRWWMYRTEFLGQVTEITSHPDAIGRDLTGENVFLVFKGLDYEAMIYVNDELVGTHKGMYEHKRIDLTGKIKEKNKLVVIFKGVPSEMGQIGYTSATSTQKSRFNYKWDFSTHLVNIGFWQDVVLDIMEEAVIEDLFISASNEPDEGDKGRIRISGRVSHMLKGEVAEKLCLKVCIGSPEDLSCQDVRWMRAMDAKITVPESSLPKEDSTVMGETVRTETICLNADGSFDEVILVSDPQLWYPNGDGGQPLYPVTCSILDGDRVLYTNTKHVGIRSFSYAHNEKEHDGALPYTFVVNGKKTFIKGVNLTPLDHIYGNVTKSQYAYLITAMVNAGVNMVRVWGGGLIEKEMFYDLCDENGILIWQEFIQSSSGIDNKPCEDDTFLELLEANAKAAVLEKRNHTALMVYSGGNELMEEADRPVSGSNKNIALLKSIVETYDGTRLFLPTSASGPREFITREKGVSHDVHGNWRYEGNPEHYELYGQSDNLFHSEFGMDGTSSVKSLEKFLPEESRKPTLMSGDLNWQHHGEWWGTYLRDVEMFGEIEKTKQNLMLFTKCSQFMQSEGLRFMIEADRRRAFQNSGTIIWQLNEPWPNASCTNLIDYFGETKSAYYQVKRAYERQHISMTYRKLNYAPDEEISEDIVVSNSGESFPAQAEVLVRNLSGERISKVVLSGNIPQNSAFVMGKAHFHAPKEPGIFFVTLKLRSGSRCISENTYTFSSLEKDILKPLRCSGGTVEVLHEEHKRLPEARVEKTIVIKNTGKEAAAEVGIELVRDDYYLLGTDNDVLLFPGEEKKLHFLLIPKHAGTFLEVENYRVTDRKKESDNNQNERRSPTTPSIHTRTSGTDIRHNMSMDLPEKALENWDVRVTVL